MSKPKIIFLGNGWLADFALPVLQEFTEVVFHAHDKDDLQRVVEIKQENPEIYAVLASFGVIIPEKVLNLFEPEGILNLHPSLLPKYRGSSPIETAILAGDNDFSYSIMKLAKAMDAGPIYHQKTFTNLPLEKQEIYKVLAENGARWISENLPKIRELTPVAQDNSQATFTQKFDKNMSELHPENECAKEIYRKIVAYQEYPKPKYEFFGKNCIILKADLAKSMPKELNSTKNQVVFGENRVFLKCKDSDLVEILSLQPEGKKPMDTKSFLNGYSK